MPHTGRFTPVKDPVPFVQESGWALGSDWASAENFSPSSITSLDCPPCSKSLQRLRYPGPQSMQNFIYFCGQKRWRRTKVPFPAGRCFSFLQNENSILPYMCSMSFDSGLNMGCKHQPYKDASTCYSNVLSCKHFCYKYSCIQGSQLYRITSSKCGINTVVSPDDEPVEVRKMYRF